MQSNDNEEYVMIKMIKDVHLPYWCAEERPQLDISLKKDFIYRLPKSLAFVITTSSQGYYWTMGGGQNELSI